MDLVREIEIILENLRNGKLLEEDSKKLIEIAESISNNKKLITYSDGNDPILKKFPFFQNII